MSSFKPLRVWPGAVFGALAGLLFFVLPAVSSGAGMIGAIGGLASALAVFVWWLFFSRAAWSERLGVVALMVVAVAVTYRLVDPSIAGGAMGYMLTFFSMPALAAALGTAVFVSRHATASRVARDWCGDGVRVLHHAADGRHVEWQPAAPLAMDSDGRGVAAREVGERTAGSARRCTCDHRRVRSSRARQNACARSAFNAG
jgi:hypothetical protein